MFAKLKPIWELEIFRNRIRLTELATGRTGERTATYPFSTASLLIAEDQCLEQEIRMLSNECFGRPGIFGRFPEVQVVHLDAVVAAAEIALLNEALVNVGASKIVLPEATDLR
ncbi:MAG TPA: hypothetical protein VNR60_01905 [Croceibacterium sp.]|nr:hypothetical protein [Croceibacterium sp.]